MMMRIITMNVCTLGGKMLRVMEFCAMQRADVIVLQETRHTRHAVPGLQRLARSKGYECFASEPDTQVGGASSGGVVVLSARPAARVNIHGNLDARRVVGVAVFREGKRPLRLAGVYLPARAAAERSYMVHDLAEWTANDNEDAMVIGDWNVEQKEYPVSEYLAKGIWRSADEEAGLPVENCGREHATGPTRTTRIDYAVVTPGVRVLRRHMLDGVGDHAAISYEVWGGKEPIPCRWPRRRSINANTTDDEVERRFNDHWTDVAIRFEHACEDGDVDEAWRIWSDTAEDALTDPDARGHRRSKIMRPREEAQARHREVAIESLRTRQLLRVKRRVDEWKRSRDQQLADRIGVCAAALAKAFPKLGKAKNVWEVEEAVREHLQREADRTRTASVAAWQEKLSHDVRAKRAWVKRRITENVLGDHGEAHPARAAAHLAEQLKKVWYDHPPIADQTTSFEWAPGVEEWIENNSEHISMENLTGDEMRAAVRRAAGTAAGPDGWKPSDMARLPSSAMDALARVWRAVLHCGRVPTQWRQSRVVGVPKTEGGERPITVMAAAWRAGASAIARRCGTWAARWCPPSVYGGVPGRSSDAVHDSMTETLDEAVDTDGRVVGIKLDLSKCFDRVMCRQADALLRRMGMPASVENVLANIAEYGERWVEKSGHVVPSAIKGAGGLPQGCPLSPLRLCGLMAAWAVGMRKAVPGVGLSAYVDDRVIWQKLEEGENYDDLRRAMEYNKEFEQRSNWRDNEGKRKLFATAPGDRRSLRDEYGEEKVEAQVKILGIAYSCCKRRTWLNAPERIGEAHRRLERINLAGGPYHARRYLVRTLVLSMFLWATPWIAMTKGAITKLDAAIERAVLGHMVPGRNRLLASVAVGPECMVSFGACAATIRQMARRAMRSIQGQETPPPFAGKRAQEVCDAVGWEAMQDNILAARTDDGVIHLAEDSIGCAIETAKRGWLRRRAEADPILGPLLDLPHRDMPEFDAHAEYARKAVKSKNAKLRLRQAVGGVHVAKFARTKAGERLVCPCGDPSPTTQHLVYECQNRPDRDMGDPPNFLGLRFCLEVGPPRGPQRARPWGGLEKHVEALHNTLCAQDNHTVVMGTDGGAVRGKRRETAAWAVAVSAGATRTGLSIPSAAGGIVGGLDAAPYLAETVAMAISVSALCLAGVREATIVCDCTGVVDTLHLLRDRPESSLPTDHSHYWWIIRQCLERLGPALDVEWIPSHGKNPRWAPRGWAPHDLCRQLNDLADKTCTEAMAPELSAIRRSDKDVGIAMSRASRRLKATTMASVRLLEHNCEWYHHGRRQAHGRRGNDHEESDDEADLKKAQDLQQALEALDHEPQALVVPDAQADGLPGPGRASA